MDIEEIVKLSSGLLTPIIAIVATYIAYQQWKTNKQKLVLDRYDRRLRIYGEVRKILSIIARDARANTEDLLRFRTSVSEADFLFGPEIMQYIDEIYKRGLNLWRLNEEHKEYLFSKPAGVDHAKIVREMHSELTWLTEQFEPAREKFRKYLDVSK